MARYGFESLEARRLLAADFRAADFNGDLRVDAEDIDMLVAEAAAGDNAVEFDLTLDGAVNEADLDYLIEDLLGTVRGDATLDGDVDFEDFLIVSTNFGIEAGWSQGNFDLDGRVAFADFLQVSTNFPFGRSVNALTYQQPDGNRYVSGWADLENVESIDIQLDFTPDWVLLVANNDTDLWLAVSDDGQTASGLILSDGTTRDQFGRQCETTSCFNTNLIPNEAGTAPALRLELNALTPELFSLSSVVPGVASHEVRSGNAGSESPSSFAFITAVGDVAVGESGSAPVLVEVDAVTDTRILTDDAGRFLVLTDPTDVYPHGIFGDPIEASGFAIIDANSSPPTANRVFSVPDDQVIESLIPMWIDVDNDGEREIILTLSDLSNGGQITILNEQGEVELQGPGIGQGFRWRHQLAVAPFGLNGELELVDVLTPHIGGVVEFRSLEEELPIVGTVPGYTSHVFGSPNIDMAVASDFDSDGIVELLLPNQQRDKLAAITRTETGAEVDFEIDLNGTLATNLAVSRSMSGRLTVAAGLTDGTLRIWKS